MKVHSRLPSLVFGLVLATVAAWASYEVVAACDNIWASSSTGACDEPESGEKTCGSFTDPTKCTTCGNGAFVCRWFQEDFPTDCPKKNDYNCNQPLVNCETSIECEYENNECQPKAGTKGDVWIQKKKRESKQCECGA